MKDTPRPRVTNISSESKYDQDKRQWEKIQKEKNIDIHPDSQETDNQSLKQECDNEPIQVMKANKQWTEEEEAQAKQLELQAFNDWKVHRRVFRHQLPSDTTILPTMWRIAWKEQEHRLKARLCARGDLDKGDKEETSAPTASPTALRTLLTMAMRKDWAVIFVDVSTAFLQGEPLRRNIAIRPPPEANEKPDIMWWLLVAIYGLTEAAYLWYVRIIKVFQSRGLKNILLSL